MPLPEQALKELKRRLRGELILPSDPDYDVRRRVFNAAVNRRPALIVRPAGTDDVIASIRFARDHGLSVTSKAGGHGATGFAVCDDALLLDLSTLRGVVVNASDATAIVQGGALWRDVYGEAAAFGLAPVGGNCDMVGVAGYTLGGGWGYLSRKYGLAVDNLNWMHVVTAAGDPVTASARMHPDLFWALRGGGGGNFGVVTAFEFALHPVSQVYGGTILWPYTHARTVLRRYCDVLDQLPDDLFVDFALSGNPDGSRQATVTAVYLGDQAAGEQVLAPFLELEGQTNNLQSRPLTGMLADYASVIIQGRLQLWKSAFLEPAVTDATIDAIVTRFEQSPNTASLFFIEPLGGAIKGVPPHETAYFHRGESLCATVIGIWNESSQTAAMERWTRDFKQALADAYSGAAYVNYVDSELHDWPTAYYGANHARLVTVKDAYDPHDLFRFEQSIRRSPPADPRPHPGRASRPR